MGDCRYCTNYHLNSHERIDDSCMGKNDCRRDYFLCNENLRPKMVTNKTDNTKELIKELEKRGYTVTHK